MNDTIAAHLETLSRAGLLLVTAAYLLGWLVTAIHLSHFGVLPLDLFRTGYIVTGSIALLPLPFVFVYLWTLTSDKPELRSFRIGAAICAFIIVVTIQLIAREWVLQRTFAYRIVGITAEGALLVAFLTSAIPPLMRSRSQAPLFASAFVSMLGIGGTFLYVYGFATFVYPELPAAFGGGRPPRVTVSPASEARGMLDGAGIEFPEIFWSSPVLLLASGEGSYLFLVPGSAEPILIAKGSIAGLRYVTGD